MDCRPSWRVYRRLGRLDARIEPRGHIRRASLVADDLQGKLLLTTMKNSIKLIPRPLALGRGPAGRARLRATTMSPAGHFAKRRVAHQPQTLGKST
mmetsp:Transcript_15077/g.46524  ORF Transcript_15077/g.46524 Transcript_15077/m.46524 type:complete len:96 (-) Transcript_15077:44-331(-)